jgi:chitosanase
MLTDLQKRAAQAIVNVFETGKAQGDYGRVTVTPGDSGHLTYGRAQTTLASGNLHLLVKSYCETDGAGYAKDLEKYLSRLAQRDVKLDQDMKLRTLLRDAGLDPVMQTTQDEFFDRIYWLPAIREASRIKIENGLGSSVVYDSMIHGSWKRIRDLTIQQYGTPTEIRANKWVRKYVAVRRDWLANHQNPLLHKTVYRMEAFQDLIDRRKWSLALPFLVRNVTIDEAVLTSVPSIRVSAEEPIRTLMLQQPPLKGSDVRRLQEALSKVGYPVKTSGVFGALTDKAVRRFQEKNWLKVDGIVGPATRSILSL